MNLIPRRDFLLRTAALAGSSGAIVVDPKPVFDISPPLYMQFMEPRHVPVCGSISPATTSPGHAETHFRIASTSKKPPS
jgi:hypothetical protein